MYITYISDIQQVFLLSSINNSDDDGEEPGALESRRSPSSDSEGGQSQCHQYGSRFLPVAAAAAAVETFVNFRLPAFDPRRVASRPSSLKNPHTWVRSALSHKDYKIPAWIISWTSADARNKIHISKILQGHLPPGSSPLKWAQLVNRYRKLQKQL